MQKLTIGLFKEELGWIQLLKQEGLSHQICNLRKRIEPEDFGVLIINHSLQGDERAVVQQYLIEGGAILSEIQTLSQMINIHCQPCRIAFIQPTQESLWKNLSFIDLDMKGYRCREARFGRINGKESAIYFGSKGKGYVLALPFDVHQALTDTRTKRKAFYFERAKKFPDERVSLVSKGEVRRLVASCLRDLFHRRGLPYCHLFYYPDGYKNALVLRMDTDLSKSRDLLKIYEIARNQRMSISWFINVKHQERILDKIAQMEKHGQEMGVHCYVHKIFPDFERNFENIRKARDLLKENGIHPIGFAAPYGMWNENLCHVLEELGFEYSSEFSLNYDDLPFYPVIGNHFSKVLQIPIHPVSIGNLRLARFRKEEMIDYYRKVIDQKWSQNEPLFLYSHPEQGYKEAIDFMIHYGKEKEGLWMTNFSSFMRWWKVRERAEYSIGLENDQLFIHSSYSDSQLFFHICAPEGQEAWVPWNQGIALKDIHWEPSRPSIEFNDERLMTKRGKGRLFLREWVSRLYQNRRKGF
ncbi:polysaccharide deacetylase family protein [candidate division TA06 bacterium]|nr:polysaccharide deacetylase family protein [candidate division TA06 bacterium]